MVPKPIPPGRWTLVGKVYQETPYKQALRLSGSQPLPARWGTVTPSTRQTGKLILQLKPL